MISRNLVTENLFHVQVIFCDVSIKKKVLHRRCSITCLAKGMAFTIVSINKMASINEEN